MLVCVNYSIQKIVFKELGQFFCIKTYTGSNPIDFQTSIFGIQNFHFLLLLLLVVIVVFIFLNNSVGQTNRTKFRINLWNVDYLKQIILRLKTVIFCSNNQLTSNFCICRGIPSPKSIPINGKKNCWTIYICGTIKWKL